MTEHEGLAGPLDFGYLPHYPMDLVEPLPPPNSFHAELVAGALLGLYPGLLLASYARSLPLQLLAIPYGTVAGALVGLAAGVIFRPSGDVTSTNLYGATLRIAMLSLIGGCLMLPLCAITRFRDERDRTDTANSIMRTGFRVAMQQSLTDKPVEFPKSVEALPSEP